uniref:SFRICE_031219 n=1 Tax=Spodoptera frugiperda TaxID=7108 RepID=A0A2H1VVA2_SPOFR
MNPLELILARNFNLWNYACAIPNEETAVAAAKAWLLIPTRTPRCPTCRGPMSREAKDSYKLKYRLRCWRRDKVSQAAKDVGVTKKTAIQAYHYLREVCEVVEAHDREMLESTRGAGGTVDIPVDASLGVPAPGGNAKVKILTNTLERQWLELKRHCPTCRSQRRLKWYMGEYMEKRNQNQKLSVSRPKLLQEHKDLARMRLKSEEERRRAKRDNDSLDRLVVQGKVEGSRPRGRSPMRWTDQVKAMVGDPVHECTRLTTNRERWRDIVRRATSATQPTDTTC